MRHKVTLMSLPRRTEHTVKSFSMTSLLTLTIQRGEPVISNKQMLSTGESKLMWELIASAGNGWIHFAEWGLQINYSIWNSYLVSHQTTAQAHRSLTKSLG